jgi:hypothetical protein
MHAQVWRLLNAALLASLAGVALLAAALRLGAADPPRAGPRQWESAFGPPVMAGEPAWEIFTPPSGSALDGPAGLVYSLPAGPATGAARRAVALTPGPAGNYTFEAAGAAGAGNPAFGLVFAWQDTEHYSALLVNGNGYAEAFRQAGATRETWFAWQQWPHILLGGEANRLRVDWRAGRATLRINDEVLVAEVPAPAGGQLGVLVQPGAEAGQVTFGWAQLWAP